jgi:protein O-GlcNAc transferase
MNQSLNFYRDPLYLQALAADRAGYEQMALKNYRELLELYPKSADLWLELARLYQRLQQYDRALEAIETSLNLSPNNANAYHQLSVSLSQLGYLQDAIAAGWKAIRLNSQSIETYLHLGYLLLERGEFEQSEHIYRRAIAIAPQHYQTYLNLGHLDLIRERTDEAIALFQKALQLKPRDPDIIYNLALALSATGQTNEAILYFAFAAYRRQQYNEAISYFCQYLDTQTGEIEAYQALANCYQALNRIEDCLNLYQTAIDLYPHSLDLYLNYLLSLQYFGQSDRAIAAIEQANPSFAASLILKLHKLRLLPILYRSQEQIKTCRNHFNQNLNQILFKIQTTSELRTKEALQAIGSGTNFYLQYQGQDDTKIQSKYGEIVHQIMKANYPQWGEKRSLPPLTQEGKIKIGYLSSCLQWHTVGMVFLGWLREASRDQFEIICYDIGRKTDKFNELFRLYSDRFYQIPNNLEAIAAKITQDCLHILVFLDIGMYAPMTQLAGLRLAPIQCAAWGHPVTSGSPTMDYFISADLLEPEDAQKHYTETLIRLPNIGICYPKPTIPPLRRSRSEFGVEEEAIVYISCQSLFKYLPQYDWIFAETARQVERAQFIFFGHPSSAISQQFYNRLDRAFDRLGLKFANFGKILPRQSYANYWNLLSISDVALDTFGFTGFLTTLDAVALGLPIVTRSGSFMRSRQSAGILKRLDCMETIAADEQEYLEIAVRLGLNSDWRNSLAEKIKRNGVNLFGDRAGVAGLEQFYRDTVRENWVQ